MCGAGAEQPCGGCSVEGQRGQSREDPPAVGCGITVAAAGAPRLRRSLAGASVLLSTRQCKVEAGVMGPQLLVVVIHSPPFPHHCFSSPWSLLTHRLPLTVLPLLPPRQPLLPFAVLYFPSRAPSPTDQCGETHTNHLCSWSPTPSFRLPHSSSQGRYHHPPAFTLPHVPQGVGGLCPPHYSCWSNREDAALQVVFCWYLLQTPQLQGPWFL